MLAPTSSSRPNPSCSPLNQPTSTSRNRAPHNPLQPLPLLLTKRFSRLRRLFLRYCSPDSSLSTSVSLSLPVASSLPATSQLPVKHQQIVFQHHNVKAPRARAFSEGDTQYYPGHKKIRLGISPFPHLPDSLLHQGVQSDLVSVDARPQRGVHHRSGIRSLPRGLQ